MRLNLKYIYIYTLCTTKLFLIITEFSCIIELILLSITSYILLNMYLLINL